MRARVWFFRFVYNRTDDCKSIKHRNESHRLRLYRRPTALNEAHSYIEDRINDRICIGAIGKYRPQNIFISRDAFAPALSYSRDNAVGALALEVFLGRIFVKIQFWLS